MTLCTWQQSCIHDKSKMLYHLFYLYVDEEEEEEEIKRTLNTLRSRSPLERRSIAIREVSLIQLISIAIISKLSSSTMNKTNGTPIIRQARDGNSDG